MGKEKKQHEAVLHGIHHKRRRRLVIRTICFLFAASFAIIFLFLDAHRDLKLSLRIHFLFFTLILLSPEYVHPQFLLCDPQAGRFPRCG